MVKFAVDAGGADNITVVLIPYLGPRPPDRPRRSGETVAEHIAPTRVECQLSEHSRIRR